MRKRREGFQKQPVSQVCPEGENLRRDAREAVERAERGLVDAYLGAGLIKQRVARQGWKVWWVPNACFLPDADTGGFRVRVR